MAKLGQVAGVGIAHRGDTAYLKTVSGDSEHNNLGNLPSVSPLFQKFTAGFFDRTRRLF